MTNVIKKPYKSNVYLNQHVSALRAVSDESIGYNVHYFPIQITEDAENGETPNSNI